MKISRREIEQFMGAEGVLPNQVMIGDVEYALPSLKWLRGPFATALRRLFGAVEVDHWEEEQNDCDDFARGAAWYGSILHNRSAGGAGMRRTGLAFGEFWYQKRNGAAHAINCAIIGEGNLRRLVFFEPQNVLKNADPIVVLSDQEKMICLGYRF